MFNVYLTPARWPFPLQVCFYVVRRTYRKNGYIKIRKKCTLDKFFIHIQQHGIMLCQDLKKQDVPITKTWAYPDKLYLNL